LCEGKFRGKVVEVGVPSVEIVHICSIDAEDGGFGGIGFKECFEFFVEMFCCSWGSVTWKF